MSSNRFDGICKNGHDNTDISDFYQYFRANGKPYLRCKKCAREDSVRRSGMDRHLSSRRIQKEKQIEGVLSQHAELSAQLENAMPWEKDDIREKIRKLSSTTPL